MKEKERFKKIHSGYGCLIVDCKTEKGIGVDGICNLLNKQEKVIKQLGQSQKQLVIKELKKVKKILEKASEEQPIIYDINNNLVGETIDKESVFSIINAQIKNLEGEIC